MGVFRVVGKGCGILLAPALLDKACSSLFFLFEDGGTWVEDGNTWFEAGGVLV